MRCKGVALASAACTVGLSPCCLHSRRGMSSASWTLSMLPLSPPALVPISPLLPCILFFFPPPFLFPLFFCVFGCVLVSLCRVAARPTIPPLRVSAAALFSAPSPLNPQPTLNPRPPPNPRPRVSTSQTSHHPPAAGVDGVNADLVVCVVRWAGDRMVLAMQEEDGAQDLVAFRFEAHSSAQSDAADDPRTQPLPNLAAQQHGERNPCAGCEPEGGVDEWFLASGDAAGRVREGVCVGKSCLLYTSPSPRDRG
eukprot:286151-Rhodomonas_salina.3